ncbi:MAG: hypothetical protein Q9M94_05790, partial [Candidatus Gracilibacteria bacterium]|nr:hypothetical protein [Candidatus Gracilibacteria bacterium]
MTENEITKIFENAFIGNLNSIFMTNTEFEKQTNNEKLFPINDYISDPLNKNTAFKDDNKDYNGVEDNNIEILHDFFGNILSNVNKKGAKNFLYYKMPFDSEFKLQATEKITELNPKLALFQSRIITKGGPVDGVMDGSSSDGEIGLEVKLVNTSNKVINVNPNTLTFSIPNGFELLDIEKRYIDKTNLANQKILTEILSNSSSSLNLKLVKDKDFGKRIYHFQNDEMELNVGENISYIFYLEIITDEVDLYSSFNANIKITKDADNYTLFDDASVNVEKGIGELTVKTLPTFSENDVYIGGGYIKNKVNDKDYIEKNSGESNYNILSGEDTELDYISTKSNLQVLNGILQSGILNETKLLNENKVSYDIIQGDKLLDEENIT